MRARSAGCAAVWLSQPQVSAAVSAGSMSRRSIRVTAFDQKNRSLITMVSPGRTGYDIGTMPLISPPGPSRVSTA